MFNKETEHTQKMGLSWAEMPFEKNPTAFMPRETGKNGRQVVDDLPGQHKSLHDHPAKVRAFQIL